MKIRALAIIAISVLVVPIYVTVNSFNKESKLSNGQVIETTQLRKNIAALSVETEIGNLKIRALRTVGLMVSGLNKEAHRSLDSMLGVAVISKKAFKWTIEKKIKTESVKANESTNDSAMGSARPQSSEWNGPWLKLAEKLKNEDIVFEIDKNAEGENRTFVLFNANITNNIANNVNSVNEKKGEADKVQIMILLEAPFFQKYIESIKSDSGHAYLMSDKGTALAHPVNEYIGTSLANDGVLQTIRNKNIKSGNVNGENAKGEKTISVFSQISKTNLILVSQSKFKEATDWNFYGRIWALALASVVFGFVALRWRREATSNLYEGERATDEYEKTKNRNNSVVETVDQIEFEEQKINLPILPDWAKSNLIESSSGEHVEDYGEFINRASETERTELKIKNTESLAILYRFVTQVKAPIIAILGHVQIAKNQIAESNKSESSKIESSNALKSIEEDARLAREYLDRVGDYCGPAAPGVVVYSMAEVLENVLRGCESQILKFGIKVLKNINSELNVQGDPDLMKVAITAIVKNAIESMDRVLIKNLKISLYNEGSTIFLRIEDSGVGILSENKNKIIEPFFTTKSPIDHKGLGLSSAYGIIKKHDGRIEIDSDPGRGTIVLITLNASKEKPLSQFNFNESMRNKTIKEKAKRPVESDPFSDLSLRELTLRTVEGKLKKRSSHLDQLKINIPRPEERI
jgi:signal transduction histidine kinase